MIFYKKYGLNWQACINWFFMCVNGAVGKMVPMVLKWNLAFLHVLFVSFLSVDNRAKRYRYKLLVLLLILRRLVLNICMFFCRTIHCLTLLELPLWRNIRLVLLESILTLYLTKSNYSKNKMSDNRCKWCSKGIFM